MKYLKNLGISLLVILGLFFVLTFLSTILSYYNILNSSMMGIIKIIIPTFSLLAGGFIVGMSSNQKGWLEGLKLSLIIIVILMLFNYLGLGNKFAIKNLIYYLILMISAIFGSMVGINKKQPEK